MIDPDETVTVSFCVQNAGNGPTTNLVGTLQNTGGVTGASGPQTYGVMAPGAMALPAFHLHCHWRLCRHPYRNHSASRRRHRSRQCFLQLSPSVNHYGVVFSETFDDVTAPCVANRMDDNRDWRGSALGYFDH